MERKPKNPLRRFLPYIVTMAALAVLILAGVFFLPELQGREPGEITASNEPPDPTVEAAPTQADTMSTMDASAAVAAAAAAQPGEPIATGAPLFIQDDISSEEAVHDQGVLIFSMRDGHYSHLFAFHPLDLQPVRLTNHPWDDITPSISPDGTQLAYSSRQNGYWDLYILDLKTGQQTRVTDTPEYEAAPTWSPDGKWLAFERYNGVSLDIYIISLEEPNGQAIQLTDDAGIDRSPAWSPQGREIAFVSTRSGSEDIWIARLDIIDERFVNLSNSPETNDRFPSWSMDGKLLVWSAEKNGSRRFAVWNAEQPEQIARLTGEGDRAVWSPDSTMLFGELHGPNDTKLAYYSSSTGQTILPVTPMPGEMYGMVWVRGPLPEWLEDAIQSAEPLQPASLWQPVLARTILPAGRSGLVDLQDVTAPEPMLLDEVDEAFNYLRQQIAVETGWDALASLENAFVALTTPPTPSIQEDWLYTGRAFSLNPLLLSANWMAITREDFGGQTYWRVYLKARYQDGSMGVPLPGMIWDLNARFAGDPQAYEQGGKLSQALPGYWIDITEIARRFQWERLPSQTNWRTFYPSIRFNQFVITGGLSWRQAMEQIYPQEALQTPTPAPTITPTIETKFGTPVQSPTPTTTPTLTQVPTRRPTWTPLPPETAP